MYKWNNSCALTHNIRSRVSEYELIHADIEVEGVVYNTYLCASEDFKKRGESKIALDDYYRTNAEKAESHYDFCVRKGWQEYVDQMIAVDYLILNRDRHGANIEILRNARARTLRMAPLFDHGLSLLYSCMSDEAAGKFNLMEDKRCEFYWKLFLLWKFKIFKG